ncbi:DNA primase [Sphingomonas spermidinifaciens]|uniref:DNA primase n=1 Tax=Sphingomonas spermidinifaciens TaxID=1141889 RepID=A0A2A4B348_9SPHN|nr:toprim domain-containing protein [Sphingomonas spermidinifaciens]PCD02209.1 DNA primase [Sphingomonas spermidinifaciens]
MAHVSDLSRQLARNAEAVCRYYLPAGHRDGRYWIAGDVHGAKGRSLYVRLKGPDHGKGAAGKWTDAATGEHGDLLDLIRAHCSHLALADTLAEARYFLSLPQPTTFEDSESVPQGSPKAALRLFAASGLIGATIAERYLRTRCISGIRAERWLRFHPRCWHRRSTDDPPDTPSAMPALIAAVTDEHGTVTGVQRTWLDPRDCTKARLVRPRRAMGNLLGNGVRFGAAGPVMVFGEGVETMLSLRMVLPRMSMIAGLSANHLAALSFPSVLRRLYVAREADTAGTMAFAALSERAGAGGVELLPLISRLDDLNSDLCTDGVETLARHLRPQLAPEDAASLP